MKPDHLFNGTVGIGGTTLAFLTEKNAAIAAGLATCAWMTWQLACGMWDRWQARRRRGPVHFETRR